MIRKMNSWPNEKEYFDPGHYDFTNRDNCYQDNNSGSSEGSGWGNGYRILLSKQNKCEITIIQYDDFNGLGYEELNTIEVYGKYLY